jgi:hypothetical protein
VQAGLQQLFLAWQPCFLKRLANRPLWQCFFLLQLLLQQLLPQAGAEQQVGAASQQVGAASQQAGSQAGASQQAGSQAGASQQAVSQAGLQQLFLWQPWSNRPCRPANKPPWQCFLPHELPHELPQAGAEQQVGAASQQAGSQAGASQQAGSQAGAAQQAGSQAGASQQAGSQAGASQQAGSQAGAAQQLGSGAQQLGWQQLPPE